MDEGVFRENLNQVPVEQSLMTRILRDFLVREEGGMGEESRVRERNNYAR